MIFVQNIIARSTADSHESPTKELRVDISKSIGDVHPKDSMQESNGCFPGSSQSSSPGSSVPTHLNAGNRPKSATKTKAEMPNMTRARLRRNPMVDKVSSGAGCLVKAPRTTRTQSSRA